MNKYMTASVLGCCVSPVFADAPVVLTPLIDSRLRWEDVTQGGKPDVADAVTARVRMGLEAKFPDKLSILAEATGTLALDNNYYNATPKSGGSAALFPAIVDPQTIGLNRLQLQYQGIAGTVVTVGRQRINFDDERFVGSAGWRDNEQTFDAVRIESMPI
ncbi:MAG: alginate export family protein, partial [Alphaproteobacteria bacterium]|nr:alginate export family protein [Alphaproteobacteria bacterium]